MESLTFCERSVMDLLRSTRARLFGRWVMDSVVSGIEEKSLLIARDQTRPTSDVFFAFG